MAKEEEYAKRVGNETGGGGREKILRTAPTLKRLDPNYPMRRGRGVNATAGDRASPNVVGVGNNDCDKDNGDGVVVIDVICQILKKRKRLR